MTQDRFLTSAEVCEMLRISDQTLRAWCREGRVRAYQIGPRVARYSKTEIEDYIASTATSGEVS